MGTGVEPPLDVRHQRVEEPVGVGLVRARLRLRLRVRGRGRGGRARVRVRVRLRLRLRLRFKERVGGGLDAVSREQHAQQRRELLVRG